MSAHEADVAEALNAARSGDESGFRELYRAVHPGVLRYLWSLVGDDAEDVASEAWLQIARDLGSFSGGADDFRGWAATIARNRAMDLVRRESRRPNRTAPEELLADLPAGNDTASAGVEALATRRAVALIASLPPDQAEAVMLRVVVGLDSKAAAQVLGKRPGAVRTAAHRGLSALSRRLAEPGPEAPASERRRSS